ncbi:hypothetical protein ACHAWF_011261 [Thalassiosira exigua]
MVHIWQIDTHHPGTGIFPSNFCGLSWSSCPRVGGVLWDCPAGAVLEGYPGGDWLASRSY